MFILVVLLCTGISLGFGDEITSNFYREESCSNAKGFCLLENECPHSVDGEYKKLCPQQQNQGAVCCKDFPQDNVNCFQLHNKCRSVKECPEKLNIGPKGCPGNEICCVLV
ncbi:hypothetical protein JTB14_030073 [Gonioctena quinquepunctata]|nr:hypothetical protein JTB14_030073 [Gonioctena quinquepunctata]